MTCSPGSFPVWLRIIEVTISTFYLEYIKAQICEV